MPLITRLLALALFATLALPARAQTIYICTNTYTKHPPAYSFGTLNLQTGAFHAIATNKRYKNVTALGFGANDKLYALCYNLYSTPVAMDEYSVDTTTGGMTLQKKFADTFIPCATADSKGVFTGFLQDTHAGGFRLFTLDPVVQSLQVGALTLVQPYGLVVADGLGHVYATSKQGQDYGLGTLAEITNVHTGAAVFLGKPGLDGLNAGFLFHGLLYTLGEDTHVTPIPGSFAVTTYLLNTGIYTLNLTTGAARLVRGTTLTGASSVLGAALAPDAEAATNSPAMRGKGNAHQ